MSDYKEIFSRKSRKTALILCIVFKELGIHDFYLGRVGAGFGHLAISMVAILFMCVGFYSDSYGSSAGQFMGYLVDIPNVIWTIYELVQIASGRMTDGEGKPVKLWNPDEYTEEYFSDTDVTAVENSSSVETAFNSNMSVENQDNVEHSPDEPRWTCKKCGNIMNYESVPNCSICGEKKTE